jgi:hypothetical protein
MEDKRDPRQPIGSASFPTGAMPQEVRAKLGKKAASPPKRQSSRSLTTKRAETKRDG